MESQVRKASVSRVTTAGPARIWKVGTSQRQPGDPLSDLRDHVAACS